MLFFRKLLKCCVFCTFMLLCDMQPDILSAIFVASPQRQAWQTPSSRCPTFLEKAPSWPLWLSSHCCTCMRLCSICCNYFWHCGWFHCCFHFLIYGWVGMWCKAIQILNLGSTKLEVCCDSYIMESELLAFFILCLKQSWYWNLW